MNFVKKAFKSTKNEFNHVIDGVAIDPLNNVTSGVGDMFSGVGSGFSSLGSGIGDGIGAFGTSLGNTMGVLSNPIMLIVLGVGAVILINAIK